MPQRRSDDDPRIFPPVHDPARPRPEQGPHRRRLPRLNALPDDTRRLIAQLPMVLLDIAGDVRVLRVGAAVRTVLDGVLRVGGSVR